MRSLLFVPADSERKLARAQSVGADALILDLEDGVAAPAKPAARAQAVAFLSTRPERMAVYVRVNDLASGLVEADLDLIVPARPDGVVLPKAAGGSDVMRLSAMLAAREALAGLADGAVRILPIATETPAALFTLGSYAGAGPRLVGLTWGAEDLSAALGAEAMRDGAGRLTDPYRLARALCLAGAAAADVLPIDTVFTHFRDGAGLEAEALAARRDGFVGKLAIHPDQVPIINEIFSPSPAAIARARAVVAAFAAAGSPGSIDFGGEMLDRPHLRQAERTLARAKAASLGDQGARQ
jgi:citrate lyase subunit beta/citryl-CoA lyase